ncbi:3-phosphoshikimate 1-carboxyvinyltransferase [Aquirufa regiilacus]|uniref:3-phosphoshikimate 1-carboxyvinyltransferase n=1 Tax=Aquirufa regiilacus TaxID=3024868 RepID=A0ABU3TU50_9BACT|nr:MULTISPECIES: 3-phosphoshikimate 1-carboxyvinyltransferase [unclassified Aquirufa]MDT8887601.1 3-phosphoshikimate 1-carboxyvinyltransferase [Aquirufa sp. LEPPI-3A]MDU0809387.1 3-phosphoshikimate 1-carboxyvinyltransferase [Aquirufa sp. LEOWEIH-7C]
MSQIRLFPRSNSFQEIIPLPSSKSESNRALIINALAGGDIDNLSNLAEARDTQTMIRLLADSANPIADVLDAGTTMRFLTAYYAITGATKKMTGTARMRERPIGILVDALRLLGASIAYENQEGYPPLQIGGFQYAGSRELSIRGDVSSQFISAILMISPLLPEGIALQITGSLGSKPYVEMTLAQMAQFGIRAEVDWTQGLIEIPAQQYAAAPFAVESDWSGASYWYSMVALSPFEDSSLELLGLKEESLQGDAAIRDIMLPLGVKSTFTGRGYLLTKCEAVSELTWDFTDCPDLAQTISVVAAVKNIVLHLTGVESLKVKETDRVLALQNELKKLGAELREMKTNELYTVSGSFISQGIVPVIDTYDDHRMAMAFAPVGLLREIVIHEPGVVAKSYPSFWNHVDLLLKSSTNE